MQQGLQATQTNTRGLQNLWLRFSVHKIANQWQDQLSATNPLQKLSHITTGVKFSGKSVAHCLSFPQKVAP